MTYIATFIAAWTFPRTRSDANPAEIHNHAFTSDTIISLNTLQPAATVWLRAGQERQPQIVLHQLPFYKPEPAVVVTTWRPRDCNPQVDKHLRSYGIMPQTHLQNPQHSTIQRTEAIVHLWQDRLQYTVRRRFVTIGRILHTRPAAITLLIYETHKIYDTYNIKSAKYLANHRIPGEAKAPHPATVIIGTMEPI